MKFTTQRSYRFTTVMSSILLLLCMHSYSSSACNQKDTLRTSHTFSWLFLNAGYRLPISKSTVIRSGHGLYWEGGINAGRFISADKLLGIMVGWGWRDQLWNTHFNPQFAHDYSHMMNPEIRHSSLDSAIITTSKELFQSKSGRSVAMPGCETRSFNDYSVYYGLIVKLPFRIPLLAKVYTGSVRSHYQGPEGLVTEKKSYNIIQLRRKMYGGELILFDPVKLILKQRTSCISRLGAGIYYEFHALATSSLYFNDGETQRNIALKHFMHTTFRSKYKSDHVFGLKLSCFL